MSEVKPEHILDKKNGLYHLAYCLNWNYKTKPQNYLKAAFKNCLRDILLFINSCIRDLKLLPFSLGCLTI